MDGREMIQVAGLLVQEPSSTTDVRPAVHGIAWELHRECHWKDAMATAVNNIPATTWRPHSGTRHREILVVGGPWAIRSCPKKVMEVVSIPAYQPRKTRRPQVPDGVLCKTGTGILLAPMSSTSSIQSVRPSIHPTVQLLSLTGGIVLAGWVWFQGGIIHPFHGIPVQTSQSLGCLSVGTGWEVEGEYTIVGTENPVQQ